MEQIIRTLLIISELARGKILRVKKFPYPIGMGEDYRIGFLYGGEICEDMSVRELNKILDDNSVGLPILEYPNK